MKIFKIIVIFLLAAQLCPAQDTTIVISASMLDKIDNQINLSNLNGWAFKQGNDTGLAELNTDTTGWKKLKPEQLTAAYKDKKGRVEGWFRIKIKFDSSFLNKQIAFDFPKWAATDLYMDGKLVASRGNMGNNSKPFLEYNGNIDPFALHFESSAPHIFTIHFAGYVSSMPPYALKANKPEFDLLGPNYVTTSIKTSKTFETFSDLWLFVCAVLSVLFWLLYFQNRRERNLFWIALCTTVLTLAIYCGNSSIGVSYYANRIYSFFSSLFLNCFLIVLIPLLLTKVFKRTMNSKLFIVLVILFALSLLRIYLPNLNALLSQNSTYISIFLSLVVGLYYIITSWKKLEGAQWAIVVGLVFSIFSLLFGLILSLVFKGVANPLNFVLTYLSCTILSLPLSLLVYVSLRFKEIIKEVQLNAKKVVQLSEEKKVHAENQQKILQEEVNKQTSELRHTLENLKSTQSQLIQSEKMASLGELTAGIAHEIQNPLNFVNNFSEVNTELIDELQQEIEKGNYEDVKAIANDIKENEEKINHHGKRAGDIVKGMLQHSQKSTGVKEPTNINALADEYLRLSYHGLRAKDKDFNATMKTDFDESIGNIKIIPQDIGRVLLNLFNNAFYAVNEQKSKNLISYEPTVSVTTKKSENSVIITVSDNGNGIPQKIIDKIFQPFFTTKPTGQGTGLGLSLSYDIVKAHGGEIKVESKEGEGSEFMIQLPV